MKNYRVYSLDSNGRIGLAQDIPCQDDLDALALGEKLAAETAVEVLEGSRLVARIKLGNAPLDAEDSKSL